MKVLVVEDDLSLLSAIQEIFQNEAFVADVASTGDEGYIKAEQSTYDLIILDVMLPGMDGLEIVRRLRKNKISTPIILVTAKDSVEDCVKGLDAGADDYVIKPFAVSILLARARGALRKYGTLVHKGKLSCGLLRLDPSLRDAMAGEKSLELSAKEYDLLEFFVCNQEQILTREQISDQIWGFDSDFASSAVDDYVHHLRKKLELYGVDEYLRTIRGVGYLFKEELNI
ncbi:response regulator transcription factor [Paenibacillus cremeus]|uniref:Response regulator transcription factor n=1 Tax=Paenibacillus cremeus TaxID=2163881 RepID=A0A559K4G5_9BACL|nr:response regulator transcription factor [Paenibacillus cremeus]TVY07035.1 response regulator transcription factor [Paenibacillus cremeus]